MTERTRSCWMKITIDNEARMYQVQPVRPLPSKTAWGVFLKNGNGKLYEINVSLDGHVGCSCMGFDSSKRCKHVDALTALGILNAEPFLQCTKLYLELLAEREQIAEERQRLRKEQDELRAARNFLAGRDIQSCYGQHEPPPALAAEPPPRATKRTRRPKAA